MAAGLHDLPRYVETDHEPPREIEYLRDVAPSDPDDVPTLYYDPARFPDPVGLARLAWEARSRTPHRNLGDWELRALDPGSLRYGSPFSDGRVERRFLARGYVTNREDLTTVRGTPPAMAAEQAAAVALQRSLVLAAAVLDAVREILGEDAPVWLQADACEVLEPMVGRRRSALYDRQERKVTTRNRPVPLIVHDDLLFGCTDFSEPRVVMASGYHDFDTLHAAGIGALHERQRAQKEAMQRAVEDELARMPPAHLAGVALWACQRVAHCRIAVEEARWYHSRPRARAIAQRFVRMPLATARDRGFSVYTRTKHAGRDPETGEARILRSEWLCVTEEGDRPEQAGEAAIERVGVSAARAARLEADAAILTDIAELYDHAGWEEPHVRRLPTRLRRAAELAFLGAWNTPLDDHWDEPRGDLQDVAEWLGDLRRWGSGLLDRSVAMSLDRILHGCEGEEYERAFESADGRAAIAFLLALMPAEFWATVAPSLDAVLAGGPPVPVRYDDTHLVGPVGVARDTRELAEPIVIRGPFLAFPQGEAERWAARASRLGPHGLLVRHKNEGKPVGVRPAA